MPEVTCRDTEMVLCTIAPDGPVDGVPVWSVVAGHGTLLSDPHHADWDPAQPDGYQMFLVSDTLPENEPGPLTTTYAVEADVAHGTDVELMSESILLHVVNRATSLGLKLNAAVAKPTA